MKLCACWRCGDSSINPLSVSQGLEYQSAGLAEWKAILQPDFYAKVEAKAKAENHLAICGHAVCRGSGIDSIIAQLKPRMS